ncbi:sulfurtransferase [Kordia algicida OT-1]|uniref:Thiosulfate sulfurtransferase SseA, putative n=1 Tax=Kordia algicida OT-1 TaxID=391587 RepID=A9DVT2_9FLAO|nr:sulfurtransferase [Kordia algicida]EDP96463.1 thiosulfate sulfurtransferase SseA, putative [Kordia algicida OT-1]
MLKENVQLVSYIVSTNWLQEHLNATNLVILNATIPKVVNGEIAEETQQVPNARFFDIKKEFSQPDSAYPNTMLDEATFTEKAQQLGINKDSLIVVYDELGIYASPRVWYMFKAMGFHRIAVLDGGFPAWKTAGFATETKKNYKGEHGNFQAEADLKLFRNYGGMLQELLDAKSIILDARSAARFTGEQPEPRAGLRSGQIPTSQNLPYTEVLENNHFKSKAALKTIFESFYKEDAPFIFSCGSGITACILALAAEHAGFDDYAVYDGSWTEWGTLYNQTTFEDFHQAKTEEIEEDDDFDEEDDEHTRRFIKASKEFSAINERIATHKGTNTQLFLKSIFLGIISVAIFSIGIYMQSVQLLSASVMTIIIIGGTIAAIFALKPMLKYVQELSSLHKSLRSTKLELKNLGWKLSVRKMSKEVDQHGNIKFTATEVVYCPEDSDEKKKMLAREKKKKKKKKACDD